MTKARMTDSADSAPKASAPKKRLHLLEIRSRQAADGSIVHHHTYADSKEAQYPHPERPFMATSGTPEEAGQHVTEQFGQNGMHSGANEEAPTPGEGTGPEPEE